jgi:hypothetical protein
MTTSISRRVALRGGVDPRVSIQQVRSERERRERIERGEDPPDGELNDRDYADLVELLKDAESSARLSDWEEDFLSSIRGKVLTQGRAVRVSERQDASLNKIREKVYA